MKQKYLIMATVGIILWFAETAYFGFNEEPVNGIEKMCDIVTQIFMFWGIIGDILSGITIQKVSNITTDNVELFNQVNSNNEHSHE